MRYDHRVKVNGIYYSPGEEVPETGAPKKEINKGENADNRTPAEGEENQEEYQDEEQTGDQNEKQEYDSLSAAELKKVAAEAGFKNVANMRKADLIDLLTKTKPDQG